jgi:hypothetical protein
MPREGGPLDHAAGVRISSGSYVVHIHPGHFSSYARLASTAKLIDEIDLRKAEGRPCSFTVSERGKTLIVGTFCYQLRGGVGPAIALVSEAHRLFIGAGEEIFCYDLSAPCRLWHDTADFGLWGWEVVRDTVLMSAELEFAAWDQTGEKLWSTFVEPDWSYQVDGEHVTLDVMGKISRFELRVGPQKAPRS